MTSTSSHGGHREGAGRKPYGDRPMPKTAVTLPEAMIADIERYGDGNLSAGIRRLYAAARRAGIMVQSVRVQYSTDSLFGSEPTDGYNVRASMARFEQQLADRLQAEYPEAEISIEDGLSDRHSADGATDTDDAADVGEIVHEVWESWDWLVNA